jgi:hypothetical protein
VGPTPPWAAIVTAFASVLTALGGLALAIGVLIPNLRATRQAVKATEDVHVMVNQQRTDAQRYQAALVRALNDAGIPVPLDQSLGPPVVEPPGRADKHTTGGPS